MTTAYRETFRAVEQFLDGTTLEMEAVANALHQYSRDSHNFVEAVKQIILQIAQARKNQKTVVKIVDFLVLVIGELKS
jgi:alpha-D-ribose 1-methylphosphonate 5-triphosphate synthase subunit PhnG